MFGVLVSPLPYRVRKALFHWLSHSPIVAKIAYGLKISFIFIMVLFVDALQRMWRTAEEAEAAKRTQGLHDVRAETNHAAKKFYSQRNVYLTGFTLFLSLVLTRVFAIILDLIETQTAYGALKQQAANNDRPGDDTLKTEIEELKKKLAAKTQDFDTLKNQAASQAVEYNRLADAYNKSSGAPTRGKKD